ncbi:MAG: hypothetical protein B6240_13665 [Desulfobacteraceae bacterium 4572_87]|nr:MAG: hypothetical protein B6240_13665 [Desulfobacteraceae bacterium 4572_87]
MLDEEAGDLISNLKLQKLVYYAQGFYLALYDEPLFNEPIEAWTHGPVIRELYRSYNEIPVVMGLTFWHPPFLIIRVPSHQTPEGFPPAPCQFSGKHRRFHTDQSV